MEQMLKLTENGLSSSGSAMMIACFAVGALLGEWIDLDTEDETVRGMAEGVKTKSDGDNAFVDAFVTASLTVCIERWRSSDRSGTEFTATIRFSRQLFST
ncbi:MAG: DUF554 family protein [Pilosibacter sp.]